jgi:cardiolipin synthase
MARVSKTPNLGAPSGAAPEGAELASGGARWRTRANALTALRLAAAPACALAIAGGSHGTALVLFALAVATDLADGRVARRYGETSSLGGLFDHATDATFVSLGLLGVWVAAPPGAAGEVPLLLPALVAAAFLQYVIDSRAAAGRQLRASFLGRWNGIAYFVLLGIPVVRDGLAIGWPPPSLVQGLGWLLVASTALSMADRAMAARRAC